MTLVRHMKPTMSVSLSRFTPNLACITHVFRELHLTCQKQFSTSTGTEKKYDVIIAGGGMVGSALACALAQSTILAEKRLLLLEASSPKILSTTPTEYSNRVSSINPSSVQLFRDLDVWNEMKNLRVKPVKKMQIWDACSDSFITYEKENMTEEVTYIIENDITVSALVKRLKSLAHRVDVLDNARVASLRLPKSLQQDEGSVRITLEDGRTFDTNLLIGADGAGSLVRKTMDVKQIGWSYGQKALVATLELSDVSDNVVAWQRFLPTGPLALLPLTGNLSSLVWSNTPDNCDKLLQLPADEFVDAVNGALWNDGDRIKWIEKACSTAEDFVSKLFYINKKESARNVRQLPPNVSAVLDGSRAAFPLALGHASNYVTPRVALIGDAAHRVHPLAGLGVNLGLGDVVELVKRLEEAVFEGCDVDSWHHLKEYERCRQMHVIPTVAAIDGLHRLYTTKMPAVVFLRSLGLQLTNACEPLKQRIMVHASS